MAWLHARFTDFVVDDGNGQNVQLDGNAPPQSPAFTIAFGLEHAWMTAAGRIVGRVDAKFQSGQHFDLQLRRRLSKALSDR